MRTLYVLFSLLCVNIISAQNIFDVNSSRKYGNYLQSKSEYKEANTEYINCLNANPNNDTLKELIAANYLRLKKYENGLYMCKTISPQYYSKNISLLFLNHCRRANQYQQADSFIKAKYPQNDSLQRIWNMEYKINEMDYTHYYKWLKQHKYIYSESPLTENYYSSVMLAHPKSPLKAALLSTVIPGAGKMYAGDRHDGIVALLTVGTFAFQAYRGYSNKEMGKKMGFKSPYFWIFGSVGVGFYFGNIYGSWKSAKKYNSDQKIYYKKKVEVLSFNLL